MEDLQIFLKKAINLIGFDDFSVGYDTERGRYLVFINDDSGLVKKFLPSLVADLDHLTRLVASRHGEEKLVLIDINNYRKERENLILEIARVAAKKASTTKQEVVLPAMNAYERRLIHLELASRPDVNTESFGEGTGRYIVVKPIIESGN